MNSIRERLIREVIRRLEANEFQTVAFDRVIRTEIPEDYDATKGSLLAVLEGREELGVNAQTRDSHLDLFLSFAVPLAAGEEAQAVANNVAAEIVMALHSSKALEEGGDGTGGQMLTADFKAASIEPNLTDLMDNCAAASVEFRVRIRTGTTSLFAA